MDAASGSVYAIIVTAFANESADTPKPVIYWQTRIGLPANGKSMAKALPTMILAAGPSIGRKADAPVLIDADEVRQGHVEFGAPKVIGYEDKAEPAAPDQAAGASKQADRRPTDARNPVTEPITRSPP